MQHSDRIMPKVLRELLELEFDYADGNGMDFEPYSESLSEEDTRLWIHACREFPSFEADVRASCR